MHSPEQPAGGAEDLLSAKDFLAIKEAGPRGIVGAVAPRSWSVLVSRAEDRAEGCRPAWLGSLDSCLVPVPELVGWAQVLCPLSEDVEVTDLTGWCSGRLCLRVRREPVSSHQSDKEMFPS